MWDEVWEIASISSSSIVETETKKLKESDWEILVGQFLQENERKHFKNWQRKTKMKEVVEWSW